MSYGSIEGAEAPIRSLHQFSSVTLENKGSVARDHMANERTFLAWLRTSLSLVTIGIGVAQLLKIQKPDSLGRLQASWAKPLGASIICIGILTLFMGFSRYFRVQQMLLQTRYPVSRYSVSILITAVSALIISVLLVLYV